MLHTRATHTLPRLGALVLLALLGLASSGCSSPPAIKTYEYVATYERMTSRFDPLLSLVYVPETRRLGDYDGIIIGQFGVGKEWVESPEQAAGYATLFRILLRRELLKLDKFGFVSLAHDPSSESQDALGKALVVEGKITRFDTGSGLMRYFSYFLWFLQGGATDLQIEGRITEAQTGRLVAEFVDRRRHLCNTPFGPNPHTFKAGYAMRVTAHESAKCLARFIDLGFEELPAAAAGLPDDDDESET